MLNFISSKLKPPLRRHLLSPNEAFFFCAVVGFLVAILLPGSTPALASTFEQARKRSEKVATEAKESLLQKNPAFLNEIEAFAKHNSQFGPSRVEKKVHTHHEVTKRDEQWRHWVRDRNRFIKGGLDTPPAIPHFVQEIVDAPCSKALQELQTKNSSISEAFVSDSNGLVVCMADPTSDYDQGDEEKWFEPFVNGVSPFVEGSKRDDSSLVVQNQVSMLLKLGEKKVGVLTIGVMFKKD